MKDSAPYLKDNPSGFPYAFEKHTMTANSRGKLYQWQAEFEVTYIEEGTARYHINDQEIETQKGDIILIQPTALYAIHPSLRQNQEATTFRIHLDHLGRNTIEDFSQRYLQPLHSGHFQLIPRIQPTDIGYEDIKACIFSIFDLLEDQPLYYDILLKSKLHELLYLLFSYRYVRRDYSDDTYQKYQKLKEFIHYLQEHYDQPLTIEDLAKRFGYSKNHFMTIFKQHTGSSCIEFLLQLRLNKASELLTQTALPIAEIATKVGFTNISNFNRQFKQHYNLTPHQYRKQAQNNPLA